jgi:hypothetical protein
MRLSQRLAALCQAARAGEVFAHRVELALNDQYRQGGGNARFAFGLTHRSAADEDVAHEPRGRHLRIFIGPVLSVPTGRPELPARTPD